MGRRLVNLLPVAQRTNNAFTLAPPKYIPKCALLGWRVTHPPIMLDIIYALNLVDRYYWEMWLTWTTTALEHPVAPQKQRHPTGRIGLVCCLLFVLCWWSCSLLYHVTYLFRFPADWFGFVLVRLGQFFSQWKSFSLSGKVFLLIAKDLPKVMII